MNGMIIIDKPVGCTSFDMVYKIRKEYNEKKAGHIGTLDPLASGVLPILLGEATKLSDYLMLHDKEYIATLKLGQATETGDAEGKIIEKKIVPKISKEELEKILQDNFIGEQMQTPPMYSAIKVNGKKLYEFARQGKTIKVQPRKISISEIEIINFDNKNAEITYRVVCSKGTYIRVLCEDIAKKIGTCGYMKALRRTRVGDLKVEDAGKIIELKDILKVPRVNINLKEDLKKLMNGVPIIKREEDGLVNLYENDNFIGIGEIKNNTLKRKIMTKD